MALAEAEDLGSVPSSHILAHDYLSHGPMGTWPPRVHTTFIHTK